MFFNTFINNYCLKGVMNLEKFNLLDLIARLGEAVLAGNDKKNAVTNGNTDGKTGDFKKVDETANAVPNVSPPNEHTPSTSEQAFVEMLRRHDKKSREIDEKLRAKQAENP